MGPKPTRSGGLKDRDEKDELVKRIADRLWGDCNGKTVKENQYGKGKVIWGKTLKQVLAERGLGPDLVSAAILIQQSLTSYIAGQAKKRYIL